MDVDKSTKNTQNAPKYIWQNCLPKTKNFVISMKNVSLVVHSPWSPIYCSHHRKCIYYYFLGRKQNFYDKHSGVSNLSILDSIAFCRKKIADFQKGTGLGGYLKAQRALIEGSRKATLVGKSENVFISCWNIKYSKYIQHEILTPFQIPTPPIISYVFLRLLLDGLVLLRPFNTRAEEVGLLSFSTITCSTIDSKRLWLSICFLVSFQNLIDFYASITGP